MTNTLFEFEDSQAHMVSGCTTLFACQKINQAYRLSTSVHHCGAYLAFIITSDKEVLNLWPFIGLLGIGSRGHDF